MLLPFGIIDERLISTDTAGDASGVDINGSNEAMKVQVDGGDDEENRNDKENDHNDGQQQSYPTECSKSTRSRSVVFKVADKLRRRVLRMVSGTNTRYMQKR